MPTNSSTPFSSRGTKIFHGVAAATLTVCHLITRDTLGKLVHCPSGKRPQGVSPSNFVVGDDANYHRLGICSVQTDGSAAVGDTVKADASGGGTAIKDTAPGITTAGVLLTLDATTNIGDVELWF